jgi:predicted nucleotidyltransferase
MSLPAVDSAAAARERLLSAARERLLSAARERLLSAARERLLSAVRVVAQIRAGLVPSAAELRDAPYLDDWTVEPAPDAAAPYMLTGLAYRLPLRRAVFYEPLLAIDPNLGWARLLGEWVVFGRKGAGHRPRPRGRAAPGCSVDRAGACGRRRGGCMSAGEHAGGEACRFRAAIVALLRAALAPRAERIKAAFVYGSIAKGEDTAKSDIDVIVIGDDLTYTDFFDGLQGAQRTLKRPVHAHFVSPAHWRRRVLEGNAFVAREDIHHGRRRRSAGDPSVMDGETVSAA